MSINDRNVTDYTSMELEDHVKHRTAMYMGSKVPTNVRCKLATESGIIEKSIFMADALLRAYLEILSNAADNEMETMALIPNYQPNAISIHMDEYIISIQNGGLRLPIEKNKDGIYIPQLVFGQFLSGGKFNDENGVITAGTNGYGSKLANIFSEVFIVEINDSKLGLSYRQEWMNCMTIMSEPDITSYEGQDNMVRVTYKLKMDEFGVNCYSQDIIDHFRFQAICMSYTSKCPVMFNYSYLDFRDINQFLYILFPEDVKRLSFRGMLSETERFEVTYLDCDTSNSLSFANNMPTTAGGVHHEAALSTFSDIVTKRFNKEHNGPRMTRTHVKNNVAIIISIHVINPDFGSQSKIKLISPEININIPPELIDIKGWDLEKIFEQKLTENFNKKIDSFSTTRRKNRLSGKAALYDAHYAGTNKSNQCVLTVCEGKSAKTLITEIKGKLSTLGYDGVGVFPLKGKILNLLKASEEKILDNEIIQIFVQLLGIKTYRMRNNSMGPDYKEQSNRNKLRYNRLIIFTDADTDGNHITGLIMTLLYCINYTILETDFLYDFPTPILSISKRGQRINFFHNDEYENWLNSHNTRGYTIKYYKGLGSLDETFKKTELRNIIPIRLIFDDNSSNLIELLFKNETRNDRKIWISNGRQVQYQNPLSIGYRSISSILQTELYEFSLENVQRALPGIDGFKRTSRKIMYASFMKFGYNPYKEYFVNPNNDPIVEKELLYNTDKYEIKVTAFGAYTSDLTNYHHGEESLYKTIIGMTASYPGRNLPMFNGRGQFGTRLSNGKDCAKPRYIYVNPQWWIKYCFIKDDTKLYNYIINEEQKCEPDNLYPIIPLVLATGCKAIGTGWSSKIPSYHPIHVIDSLLSIIDTNDCDDIFPYFHGFKGEIKPIIKDNRLSKIEIYGKFEIINGVIRITELPIETSVDKYLKLCTLGKLIEKYPNLVLRDHSDNNKIEIWLENIDVTNITHKDLHLVSSMSLNNMYILNEKEMPIKYLTAKDIIKMFHEHRIKTYEQRRLYKIEEISELVRKYQDKLNFLLDYDEGKIKFKEDNKRIPLNEIKEQVISLGHDPKFLRLRLELLSKDKISELEIKIKELLELLNYYQTISPEEIWKQELNNFRTALLYNYGSTFLNEVLTEGACK